MDFIFEGKQIEKIKKMCMNIIEIMPELDHIKEEDFDIIIVMDMPPRRHGMVTLADMNYMTHWLIYWIEYLKGEGIPNYIMKMYPAFFKLPKFANPPLPSQVQILIHELNHIPENKRGCKDHIGFGDEQIFKLYEKRKRKLKKI